MLRNNNTYGELINNKFSELITTNSAKTWGAMRDILDTEMPEDRRRKWLTWFATRTGFMAIVLFSLVASATGVYINYSKKNNNPVKEQHYTNTPKRDF
jgi:hypothetical protein